MDVTLLGTGSALPSPRRVQSGLYVEHRGEGILLDCGSGVVHRLAQIGVDQRDVSTVLLSHHHLDHVVDLPTFIKARILANRLTCRVIGLPGTSALCEQLLALDDLGDRGEVIVEEHAPGETFDLIGSTVQVAATDHTDESVAFRFDDAFVYSGDTAPTSTIFDLADGAHTLIHECGLPDHRRTDGHTSPTDLIDGVRAIDIERLVITHLFPAMEREIDDVRERLRVALDVDIHVGEDRLQLGIPY